MNIKNQYITKRIIVWSFFVGILIAVIITVSGCAEELPTSINQNTEIIEELSYILSTVENGTAQQTIKMVIEAPEIINSAYIKVPIMHHANLIYNEEVAPYKSDWFYNYGEYIELGSYKRYMVRYNEEHKNGSVKLIYLTVFVEVDEDYEPISPLHVYAYNRTMEKRTGILEPYTSPRWFNSFIQVGGIDTTEMELIWE